MLNVLKIITDLGVCRGGLLCSRYNGSGFYIFYFNKAVPGFC